MFLTLVQWKIHNFGYNIKTMHVLMVKQYEKNISKIWNFSTELLFSFSSQIGKRPKSLWYRFLAWEKLGTKGSDGVANHNISENHGKKNIIFGNVRTELLFSFSSQTSHFSSCITNFLNVDWAMVFHYHFVWFSKNHHLMTAYHKLFSAYINGKLRSW